MKMIVTLTMNPAIDKSSSVGNVVAERKLYCTAPRFEPGGGGINVCRAIKKLGGEALALYPSGGPTGQMLQFLFDQEGLTHRPVPVKGWSRESLSVLEESTGQQYRFGMPGPELSDVEWRQCLDELLNIKPTPDYIVASGSLPPGVPPDFYAQVVRMGKDMNAKVIVDATGEALSLALKEGVFLIKPNIREFRDLVGQDVKEESQIKVAARTFVENGQSEVVVISLGASGALMVSKDVVEHIVPPAVPIISKVGAGDSTVAGIVLSLSLGWTLKEAVRFGIAAGAAAVMTPGTELCRKEDTERLYQAMVGSTK
ncbi:MAG: 1-phosphofructokinase family hexose kinase [Nitrospirae bacterium]|nr:1-phosphofructokinase family hexose kinase [Nitrospirota bacterium]